MNLIRPSPKTFGTIFGEVNGTRRQDEFKKPVGTYQNGSRSSSKPFVSPMAMLREKSESNIHLTPKAVLFNQLKSTPVKPPTATNNRVSSAHIFCLNGSITPESNTSKCNTSNEENKNPCATHVSNNSKTTRTVKQAVNTALSNNVSTCGDGNDEGESSEELTEIDKVEEEASDPGTEADMVAFSQKCSGEILRKSINTKKNFNSPRVTRPHCHLEDNEKLTILDDWTILPRTNGICVEGYRRGDPEEEAWHSSKIKERLGPLLVATASGSKYKLVGNMNVEWAEKAGIPHRVVQAFLKGFPMNWQELVKTLLKASGNKKADAKPNLKKERSSHEDLKKITKSTDVITSKSGNRNKRPHADLKAKPNLKTNVPSKPKLAKPSLCDENHRNISSITVSRSGRKIIPPLAFWKNERLSVGDNTEIIAGSPDYIQAHANRQIKVAQNKHTRTKALVNSSRKKGETESEAVETDNSRSNKKTKKNQHDNSTIPTFLSLQTPKSNERKKTARPKRLNRSCNSSHDHGPTRPPSKTAKSRNDKRLLVSSDNDNRKSSRRFTEPLPERPSRRKRNSDAESSDIEQASMDDFITRKKKSSKPPRRPTKISNAIFSKSPIVLSSDNEDDSEDNDSADNLQASVNVCITKSSNKNRIPLKISNSRYNNDVNSDSESELQDNLNVRSKRSSSKRGAPKIFKLENTSVMSSESENESHDTLNVRSKKPSSRTDRRRSPKLSKVQNRSANQRTKNDMNVIKQKNSIVDDVLMSVTNKSKHVGRTKLDSTTSNDTRKTQTHLDIESDNDSIYSQSSHHSETESDNDSIYSQSSHEDVTFSKRKQTSRSKQLKKNKTKNTASELKTAVQKVTSNKKSKQSKAPCNKQSASEKSCDQPRTSDDTTNDDMWSKEEIKKFHNAFNLVPADSMFFWETIAGFVKTKTSEQCVAFHQKDAPKEKPQKPKPKSASKVTDPSQITGGKKTLKRKRQLRELLEHHNEGYEDDFFDSTPLRNERPAKIPRLSHDDSFENFHMSPSTFETPACMRSTTGRAPVSDKKTPHGLSIFSPGMMVHTEINALEQYVHRLKQGQKGRKLLVDKRKRSQENSSHPDNSEEDLHRSPPPVKDLFKALSESQHDSDEDSDEKDFYFSE